MILNNIILNVRYLFIALLCGLTLGCANTQVVIEQPEPEAVPAAITQEEALVNTEQELLGYFSQWEGTPYRFGGNSRKGIDCSAYVRNAYRDVFSMEVPRTTLGQATLGQNVDRKSLIPGDLVLFKTSKTARHVGVVVNGDKFMHVSEMKGVIISDLNNVYWRKKYWKAVRPDNGVLL